MFVLVVAGSLSLGWASYWRAGTNMFKYNRLLFFTDRDSSPEPISVVQEALMETELREPVVERPVIACYGNKTIHIAFGNRDEEHHALLGRSVMSRYGPEYTPIWIGGGYWYHERSVGDNYGEFKIYGSARCPFGTLTDEVRERGRHFLNRDLHASDDEILYSGLHTGLEELIASARSEARKKGHVIGPFEIWQSSSHGHRGIAYCATCGADADIRLDGNCAGKCGIALHDTCENARKVGSIAWSLIQNTQPPEKLYR